MHDNERTATAKQVAMQMTTDEGAFICNVDKVDLAKIETKRAGTFIVAHCVIRLDAMFEGQFEIHRTKMIEASSIDYHQVFCKKTNYVSLRGLRIVRKGRV
jgi:hypothetical protein